MSTYTGLIERVTPSKKLAKPIVSAIRFSRLTGCRGLISVEKNIRIERVDIASL